MSGEFTHVEIPADDPDRAKRFYESLFGWSCRAVEGYPDYHLFTTPAGEEGTGGAIGRRGQSAPERMRTYIQVDSIDDTLARITEQGGSAIEARTEVPGQDWYAVFRDPEGNELALWEQPSR